MTPYELNTMLYGWAWRHGYVKREEKDTVSIEQRKHDYEELKRKFA